MQLEYDALAHNCTWEEVPFNSILPDAIVHNPIWCFKVKNDGCHKSHVCFDGCFQKHGVDFFDTFSPVIRMETI